MKWFSLSGQPQEDSTVYQEPEPEEMEVFPLRDIPVTIEDPSDITHDGVTPCGDPTCYCAVYGYSVPSLRKPGGV